jgi:hypothetical protein
VNDRDTITIEYALPDINRRRWSKAAIASILFPVVAFPAIGLLIEALAGIMPWSEAQRVGRLVGLLAHLIGLVFAAGTLRHIRLSSTRLRGRMLAVIGIALNSTAILLLMIIFYMRSI